MRKTLNGKLATEIAANDYHNINGTVFPFKYTIKSFDSSGEVIAERKYIFEDVQFNVEFSEDEFKIAVPAGTRVLNPVISESRTLTEAGIFRHSNKTP